MTVYAGAVKELAAVLQAAYGTLQDIETASAGDVAAVDKAVRDLNAELDLRIGELDEEIAGDTALSAFALAEGSDALATIPQLGLELANVEQMTRLLDARSYSGRIDRLLEQVR